jgi:DNA-binding response OmpR family regulator
MRKILVIDDEVKIADIIAEYLSIKGFEVKKAYGGQEGLDAIKQDPSIDLIILDKKMPKVDGLAVMRRLKRLGINAPIIVITGSISLAQLTHSSNMRARHVLSKPLRLAKLLKIVNTVLASKGKKKK